LSDGLLSVFAPPRATAFLARPAPSLPYPLEEPGCRLYEWGRHGLWHGLAAAGLEPGNEVLVPAYHHGAEVGALVDRGLRCRFYEAGRRLEPDQDELEALLGPRTRALYIIHTLGFGLDAPRWRRWCDERGLLLIEDVAMAWLAHLDDVPLGSFGDISFFSPWKTFGLPDCGAVVCRGAAPRIVPVRYGPPLAALARGTVKWLAGRHGWVTAMLPDGPRDSAWDPEFEFSVWNPENGPREVSLHLLRRMARGGAAEVRRAHHARLVARLGPIVPEPFERPQAGACPLAAAVETHDKPGLLRHLRRRRIEGMDFWSEGHPALPADRFPAAARRRATTVLLPIHQELADADVDRVADAVLEFVKGG